MQQESAPGAARAFRSTRGISAPPGSAPSAKQGGPLGRAEHSRHSDSTGCRVLNWSKGLGPAGVAEGRGFASGVLAEWGQTARQDDVVLCVSELVTNALLHTRAEHGAWLGLRRVEGCCLVVEVWDTDSVVPATGCPVESWETGGRGLAIVTGLADAVWWHRPTSGGKIVCARFDETNGAAA